MVRQTVCRDPQLTSITEHSASFLPLKRESVDECVLTAEIVRSYPMETSMGAGCRVTISEGLESQLDPV